MELRQLFYFKALIEAETFSLAAKNCAVAQPSLSQQIIKLEEELGETLVTRSRSGIKLTSAGKLLWSKAKRILSEVEDIERIFKDRSETHRHVVRLGSIPTIAPYWLPTKLALMREKEPNIGVDLVEEKTEYLIEKVLSGEVDFAVCSDITATASGITTSTIFNEPLWLAVPSTSTFAKASSVSLHDLDNAELLVLHEGHCLRDDTIKQCRAQDFQPKRGMRCDSLTTMLNLIEAGAGIAFVPEMTKQTYHQDKIKFLSLKDAQFTRNINLISQTDKMFLPHEKKCLEILLRNS